MSTQSDSIIRVSRKNRECGGCHLPIFKGAPYLSYAPGQRTRIPFCTVCMVKRCADLSAVMDWQTNHPRAAPQHPEEPKA